MTYDMDDRLRPYFVLIDLFRLLRVRNRVTSII